MGFVTGFMAVLGGVFVAAIIFKNASDYVENQNAFNPFGWLCAWGCVLFFAVCVCVFFYKAYFLLGLGE